ncbi:MAG: hypothetical protein QW587_07385, partial [Candidatus Bathyarchaeia archaeon]
ADATSSPNTGFNITVTMKNTGQKPITLDRINLNGKPYNTAYSGVLIYYNNTAANVSTTWNTSLAVGLSRTFVIHCPSSSNSAFTSGVSLEVALLTTSGNSYPKAVTLP